MSDADAKFDLFDDAAYLHEYGDVLAALKDGAIASAYRHYVSHGAEEGRHFPVKATSINEIVDSIRQIGSALENNKLIDNFKRIAQRVRKDARIIFYTPRTFEGNLKYAFLETIGAIRRGALNADGYFLTLDANTQTLLSAQGLPVLLWRDNGADIIKSLLTAAILVDDAFFIDGAPTPRVLHAMLSAAHRVNVWHGTQLRKILLQKLSLHGEFNLHYSTILRAAVDNNTFCGSSESDRSLFEEAMVIDTFAVIGYARNDVFYRDLSPADLINVDEVMLKQLMSRPAGARVVLYAPTWREGNPHWIAAVDVAGVAKHLSEKDITLLVNLHPFEMAQHAEWIAAIPNVKIVKPGSDIYPIMKWVDALITDYSSIAFDFLHAKRPIVFFRPDHQAYLGGNRALIPERIDALDVPLADDSAALVRCVLDMLTDGAAYVERLAPSLHRLHAHHDGRSGARCVDLIASTMRRLRNG